MIQQNLINISGQTYRRGNKIGSGGYAVIYQGENIQTHEKVAIRIANDMTEDEYNIHQILIQQKKRFLIDIKGIEYQEQNARIVIAMELGIEDFHSFMEKNEFKQFTNLDKNLVFYQMVSAVHELHELQYFHRDLKTENFIVIENFNQNRPKIKLIDFGLCKHIQNQNRQTQNAGTILFMAPEVSSSDQYDKSSDIWSLGCIYYEIMTTQSFLQGTTYQALIEQIQTIQQNQIDQKIDQITQINLDEKNLLKRMLQKEPSQRLTMKDILQQLDNLTKRNFQPIQQGQSFNNFPKIQIQPQQFPQWNTQNQQQLSVVRLQTQIKNDTDQKYQKQYQEDIAKQKKEIAEQQKYQILQKKIEIQQQNQEQQRMLEKEIKQKYDLKIQQCLQDKEKLKELEIACELETQNRLNQLQIQQKKELENNLNMFQQQIKQDYETKLEKIIKEKETQIYERIEQEQKLIFEQKLKELNRDENEKKQQQFLTKKKSVVYLVTSFIELLSKNQNIMIVKQKVLKTLEQQNLQQVSLINQKVNNFLSILEQNLSKANQVKQDLQKINDYCQLNKLGELENEYQEKITQQTTNQFLNIQQIDQDIQNLNRNDQQIIKEEQIKEKEQKFKRLQELKTTLEQQLSQQRDQLNKMKQSANILLHGFQEYEMVKLIQKLNNEIVALNQQELKLNLIQNQFEQIKDQDLFRHEESLNELSQQCSQIEKQSQNIMEILNIINQEFQKNEQIQLQYLNNLLNEVENQSDFLQHKQNYFRKEFQTIQIKEIDDYENKFYEIQQLIRKIYFQRQQFCIKKQKQTFDLIQQKLQEVNILYEQAIEQAEQQRELNKCKQQSYDIQKRLEKLKQNFQLQIETFQQQLLKFRVNQEIQLQLQQQLDILKHYFKNYVQKFQDFQNLINETIKDYQLNEVKQSLNEQDQFYQESEKDFKALFQQAQTIYLQIDINQQKQNEKVSQFNDLSQKMYQLQQKSKECRFSKDISFCGYLCQWKNFEKLLIKYEAHFDKCNQDYSKSEEIYQAFLARLNLNQEQFSEAKKQNQKLIDKIRNTACLNFSKLEEFLKNKSNVHKEQIKLVNDSGFYEKIYKSFQSYEWIMQKVDFIKLEIQNQYSRENQEDENNTYKEINIAIKKYIIQLDTIKESLNLFEEIEFQTNKKCFIRLIFYLIVIQLKILDEITERQLIYNQQQLEKNLNQDKFNYIIKELKNQMIAYQHDQTKFKQFLNLNDLFFSVEYIQQIENNETEIEKQFLFTQGKDRAMIKLKIKKKELVDKIEDLYRTMGYNKIQIFHELLF